MDIYVQGKRISLSSLKAKGKGGEADVYELDPKNVVKIYKAPNHADLQNQPHAQQAAKERILEHQQKLPAFPRKVPAGVIGPTNLVTDRKGKILGYVMPFVDNSEVLLRYGERNFRQVGITNNDITEIFKKLYQVVVELHKMGIVIGDFNDLNVLVRNLMPYVIDADSMQFGSFLCKTFTATFVDPVLCDPNLSSLMLVQPHTEQSDWYAYNVMLFQSWLFVGPYGGMYRPKGATTTPPDRRPLERITVFNPAVKYPRPAIPYTALNNDLQQHFFTTFEKDRRQDFPLKLINDLEWKECTACGATHCCNVCPQCQTQVPKQHVVITVKGNVTSESIFSTPGIILHASYHDREFMWLAYENGQFVRERKTTGIKGNLDPRMRFRLNKERTFIGFGSKVAHDNKVTNVSQYGSLPMFDVNSSKMFWEFNGDILREATYAPMRIGGVIPGQTLFWVGENFGFGFYRAGELDMTFMFNTNRPGINHLIKLPFRIQGQLIDSTCMFFKDLVWFGIVFRYQGVSEVHWTVLNHKGEVLGHTSTPWQDGSWAGTVRGKSPVGKYLFAATDDGLVRASFDQGNIFVDKVFPDTEPFIDSGNRIVIGAEGIYVISSRNINLIKMS
jgi:serine/threonine protein kinase